MGGFSSSVEVQRPVEQVFGFFMHMDENAPRIGDPEADSATKEPPGETREGTTFTLHSSSGTAQITFVSIRPNESIDFKGKIGPIRPTARLTFQETSRGTRVQIDGTANPIGPLKLISGIANRRGKREWDERLARIKQDLESS